MNLFKRMRHLSDVQKLYAISLLSGMLFYTPVMTLFLLQRDISVAFLVIAQTAFSVAMMLSEVPTGVLADKYGQRFSLQASLTLNALGMMQLLLVRNELALLAFFAVRGISVAFQSGSDEALLYESYNKEYKNTQGYSKAFGRYLSYDILGFVIAVATSGVVVQFYGAMAYIPLIILTSLAVGSGLAISFMLSNGRRRKLVSDDFKSIQHAKNSFRLIKNNRTIFALMIAGLLTLNGEYFLRQTYQPFFEDAAVPALFLGLALAIGKLLNYFVIRNSHILEERLSVDKIILLVNTLIGVSFIGLWVGSNYAWVVVMMFIVIQALLNAQRPVVSDYVNQRTKSHQRSAVLSAISFTQNLAQVAARLLLGASVGLIGTGTTYAMQGMYMLVGATAAFWYLRKCGCTHRVRPHEDSITSLKTVEEASY